MFKNRPNFAPDMKYVVSIFLIFMNVTGSTAQVHDFMNSSGKMNVVFAGVFIVFIGIIYFLFKIDRKINKLENK